MSIQSKATQKALINLRKLAEEQKKQRVLKLKNRFLKQTRDIKITESLSPITKKNEFIETTKQLGETVKKSDIEDENTQTPDIQNVRGTQSLRDTLAFMKKSRNFFKLVKKPNGRVFWNDVSIKPVGENRDDIIGKEYDISPGFQNYFSNTRTTSKLLNDIDKMTVYQILKDVCFYVMKNTIGLKSARMQEAINFLPKAIDRILNPPLQPIQIIEDSNENESENLQEGMKILFPSNITDIHIRFEILLGLNFSGHTDTFPEASNLIDELYKRGEIQNEQQYRNALDNLQT